MRSGVHVICRALLIGRIVFHFVAEERSVAAIGSCSWVTMLEDFGDTTEIQRPAQAAETFAHPLQPAGTPAVSLLWGLLVSFLHEEHDPLFTLEALPQKVPYQLTLKRRLVRRPRS